eukprot:scaffold10926_cov163-Amphora_coffeaeformis.AAC.6
MDRLACCSMNTGLPFSHITATPPPQILFTHKQEDSNKKRQSDELSYNTIPCRNKDNMTGMLPPTHCHLPSQNNRDCVRYGIGIESKVPTIQCMVGWMKDVDRGGLFAFGSTDTTH